MPNGQIERFAQPTDLLKAEFQVPGQPIVQVEDEPLLTEEEQRPQERDLIAFGEQERLIAKADAEQLDPLANYEQLVFQSDIEQAQLPLQATLTERAKVGLGASVEDEARILGKILGEKFPGQLVQMTNEGKLNFRRTVGQQFIPFDGEAISFEETAKDIADLSGLGLETATQIMLDMLFVSKGATFGSVTGAAAGAQFSAGNPYVIAGGAITGLMVGAGSGLLAAQSVGGYLTPAIRAKAMEAFTGVARNPEELAFDQKLTAFINIGTLGLGTLIGPRTRNFVKGRFQQGLRERKIILARSRLDFDNLMASIGVTGKEDPGNLSVELIGRKFEETGELVRFGEGSFHVTAPVKKGQFEGFIAKARRESGQAVGNLKKRAIEVSDDGPVDASEYINKMDDIIAEQESKDIPFDSLGDGQKVLNKLKSFRQLLEKQEEEFGQGMVQLSKLDNNVKAIGKEADFAKSVLNNTEINAIFETLAGIGGESRMKGISSSLQNAHLDAVAQQQELHRSAAEALIDGNRELSGELSKKAFDMDLVKEAEIAKQVMDDFSQKDATRKAIIELFKQKRGPDFFVDSLFSLEGGADRVRSLKLILSDNPELFFRIRDHWMARLVEGSLRKISGTIDADIFERKLLDHGPEFLKAAEITPKFIADIKNLASTLRKIEVSDVLNPRDMTSFTEDAAKLASYNIPEAKIRVMFRMAKNAVRVADELNETTIPTIAKRKLAEERFGEAAEFLKLGKILSFVIDNSDKVIGPDGKEIYKPRLAAKELLRIGAVESSREWIAPAIKEPYPDE